MYQVSRLLSAEMNSITKRFWNLQPSQEIQGCFHEMWNQNLNCQNIIENHIQHTGIWLGNKRLQLHWIAKISILCFFITTLTQFIALVMAKNDPKTLFACSSVLTFCSVGFLKLCSLLIYQKFWRSLITQSSSLENHHLNNVASNYEYESDDEENNDLSDVIQSYTKGFHNISIHLSKIYFFSVVIFMISPFVEYSIYVYSGSIVPVYPHILPGLTPLDFSILGYSATIIAEAIAAVYCVIVHKAFDLTSIGLMIFVRGQFLLVQKLSERIGGKGKKSFLCKKRDDRAHYRIKNCHRIHVSLLKLVSELAELIQDILGIYFLVATLTLCSVAVQLQWDHLSETQIIALLQYMCATLTQLFLFCRYGDAVLNQSSVNPGEGPFGAAIWCLGTKVRREIAILCVGMSQPCRILAGPFNTLNLPSFIQVVRAAYSIYAILKNSSK